MTTVGYGDLVAYTTLGRLVCIIAAFLGAFMIGMQVNSVAQLFDLNDN